MIQRCENPKFTSYSRYGAKGINVCDEWRYSSKAFIHWALDNGYSDELTIDRIDNKKGYSPFNCRWATHQEQTDNREKSIPKGSNHNIEYLGKTQSISAWAKELNINHNTLRSRILNGWSIEKAFFTPVKHSKPTKETKSQEDKRYV